MQQFRDLFAEEALRPGDQGVVGSLTILFTDLVGSTQMYRDYRRCACLWPGDGSL
ncbi:MAG: hypothetical protein M5U34_46315 [Chloroflexi bacterium]|nr:hypothetical protein [Chloroflexota bacterium]